MSKPITTLGIVAFKKAPQLPALLTRIIRWSKKNHVTIYLHPLLKGVMPARIPASKNEQDFINRSEAFASLGGDGTFLSLIHMCKFSTKPVVGINLGGLGFLTSIGEDDLEDNLTRIARGQYSTVNRMILEAAVIRRGKQIRILHAFNDIFINRSVRPKIISIGACYGNDFISDFQGDGLIIATPAGSTAYSLAAGGPIVEPNVNAFILTPLCPHSLTERPMILSSQTSLRLTIGPGESNVMLSADGLENIRVSGGDEIVISHAGLQTNIVDLSQRTYFDLLRVKLEWGRNYKKRSSSCDDS
jgi:NAD+ kinase